MIESEHDDTDTPDWKEMSSDHGVRCPLSAGSLRLDMLDEDVRQSLAVGGCPIAASVEERVRFESLLSELVAEVQSAGAAGFVLKRSASVDLIPAVREVLASGVYVSPAIHRSIPTGN